MTSTSETHVDPACGSFSHEALLYAGEEGFLAGTVPFVRAAVASAEPILVVVSARKIGLLRSELGGEADAVEFADMEQVGGNPARIIPVWRRFVDEHASGGHRLAGVGEPVWPERSAAELAECERHEALLNVAFGGAPGWSLLCPYDTATLAPAIVETARRTHPVVRRGALQERSASYRPDGEAELGAEPLPEPTTRPDEWRFADGPLEQVRRFVADRARRAGLEAGAAEDLVLAVNEVAANSVRHGGGRGVLRVWRSKEGLVCEVRDDGHISQPLAGRVHPTSDAERGRGLWMVNHLCDLVQLRSSARGTIVRLHAWIP